MVTRRSNYFPHMCPTQAMMDDDEMKRSRWLKKIMACGLSRPDTQIGPFSSEYITTSDESCSIKKENQEKGFGDLIFDGNCPPGRTNVRAGHYYRCKNHD